MVTDLGIKDGFILAGGLGERLKPLTGHTPKILLPVQGKSIIEWNIELLARFGVKRVVLGVGHMAEHIEEALGKGEKFGVELVYSREEKPLGTAGALKNAEKHFSNGTFFMMNGDELKDFDLGKMLALHRTEGAMATIALVGVGNVSSFGVVDIEDNRIKGFVEKPKPEEAPSNLINSGLYILEQEILKLVPGEKEVSIEREVFPKIADMGKLFGYRAQGQWFPTDNKERYGRAGREWKGFVLNLKRSHL